MPFEIPESVRELLAAEPEPWEPIAPEEPAAALPDPSKKRIGQFMAPEHGAPDTQRVAAILYYPKSGTKRRLVLDQIAYAGARGMIDEELERALLGRHQTISARRNELMRDGWICDSGTRRLTSSGREAVVWVLSEVGRSEYRPDGSTE